MPDRSWAKASDESLLQLRFMDLGLSIKGTWLQTCLGALTAEMRARGLMVRPHAWLSNEWFSPDNTPGIAIPFYLAHPRLARLERRMMLQVEGGTRLECMRILRHEAGHVLQHAYKLHRRRRWQNLFGPSSKPYPTSYRPDPASTDFVQHLPQWYAQSHPEEDFAETFAVWLTPRFNWRKRYAEWGALEKLVYTDELMGEIVGAKPILTRRIQVDPIDELTTTLGEHYEKKREQYAVEKETSYDGALERIFSPRNGHGGVQTAAAFIRSHRPAIRGMVTARTGEEQPMLDVVLDDMMERCRLLRLRAPTAMARWRLDQTVQLAIRIVRARSSGSRGQWFAV